MKKFSVLLLSLMVGTANAAALNQLKSFMSSSKTLSASFTQTVTSKNKRENASGVLEISRPGKFRWSYSKPYEQLIVGDGKTLWIYDAELSQVTKRSMDAALGSSPAALLAGSNEIERSYNLREIGKRGALEWLSASPKKEENTFEAVRMGFRDNMLAEMELVDNFGNTTRLVFSNMKKNPAIPAKQFTFTPPKGADVISD